MADITQQKSPQDAWNENLDLIQHLVKEKLTRLSGPSACEKHYEVALDKAIETFQPQFKA